MILLTHNMLISPASGGDYPLIINVIESKETVAKFHKGFICRMLGKIDWSAFKAGAVALSCAEGLPEQMPNNLKEDEEFLRKVHHALMEVHLEEGVLVCPATGREYRVEKGIPNMLLNEDEL